jgi:hypothetical protein
MHIYQRGFIALISVVIISVVLLAAVISFAQFGVQGRITLLDIANKGQSERLAYGCLQVALIAISNDPLITKGYTIVPVGTGQCAIESIAAASGISTVRVSASSTKATTNIEARVTSSTAGIISVQELATM